MPPPPPRDVITYGNKQPSGYQQPSRTNGLAVASLVLGLITLCGLGSFLAIVFGFSALSSIKHDPTQRGRGMAIAGVILGFIGFAAIVLLVSASLIGTNANNKFSTIGNSIGSP